MYIENDKEVIFNSSDNVPEYLGKLIKDFPITPSLKYSITDSYGNDITDMDCDELYEIYKKDIINIDLLTRMFDYENCIAIENLDSISVDQFAKLFEYPLNRAFREVYIKYFDDVSDIFDKKIDNVEKLDDAFYELDNIIEDAYAKMNEHPEELRELFISFYEYMLRKISSEQAYYKAIHYQPDNYFTDEENNCVYYVAICQYSTLYTRIPTKI